MNFKKKVTSTLALTLLLGGSISSSTISTYANEKLENNKSISMENSQVKVEENGDIIITKGDLTTILTPVKHIVEDRDGNIKELKSQLYASTFTVQLQSTVTKGYTARLYFNNSSSNKMIASANLDIKVKCTGRRTITATSHFSKVKGYNGYSAKTSTRNGSNSSISITQGTLSGAGYSKTYESVNEVYSDAGSAQGYMVYVRQTF